MLKSAAIKVLALGIAAAPLSGCLSEEEASSEKEFASTESALSCLNNEGTNYALAGLAAATAMELKRWNTAADFRVVTKCGYTNPWWNGCAEVVELTPTGKAQCSDGECSNVQAILDFQRKEAYGQVTFPGGDTLVPDVFASRLASNLKAQVTCNSRPDNHDASNCPTEPHRLEFTEVTEGICESDYWFHAHKADSSSGLDYPAQLKNQLITFGSGNNNPYLAFDWQGDDVKVDPGPGTVSADPISSGSCPTLSSSGVYSRTNLTGQCCIYKNRKRYFRRSSFNRNYYLCR